MFRSIRTFVLLAMTALPAAASAEWKEATSTNFVVYSEGSESQLRDFAVKLEKFNFVLRAYHRVTEPPSPVKLKVYLLTGIGDVQKMAGSEGVAGYYITDARSPMMVGTRTRSSNARIDSESILLHEYTHHFMYQYFPASYPTWYSEGFAEFWGATDISKADVVDVGLPANHRYGSFFANRWLHVRKLLTAQSYADVPEVDLLYAEGWLLVRYGFDHPERLQQIQAYLNAINGGGTYEQAMKKAFPDVDKLNSELFSYAGKSRFMAVRLPFRTIDPGPIAMRALRPAEQALLDYEIRLGQGVRKAEIGDFARKLDQAAARFPDDPFALDMLSEAQLLADDKAAAKATVDRLLKISPDHPRGLMRKGRIDVEALRAAGSRDQAAWRAARAPIVRAGRLAPNDPLVLEAYYDGFAAQGALPPEAAQSALYAAMELAPSDPGLRYRVAADFERRNMLREAIAVIRPSALVIPHRGDETERDRKTREQREEKYRQAGQERRETAREMLDRLEKKLADTK